MSDNERCVAQVSGNLPNNLTREENDRLLELMDGCRHVYIIRDNHLDRWLECRRCGRAGWGDVPAVGDGHVVMLGEVTNWWIDSKGDCASILLWDSPDDGLRCAHVHSAAEHIEGDAVGPTLVAALGRAILAAMDGERE